MHEQTPFGDDIAEAFDPVKEITFADRLTLRRRMFTATNQRPKKCCRRITPDPSQMLRGRLHCMIMFLCTTSNFYTYPGMTSSAHVCSRCTFTLSPLHRTRHAVFDCIKPSALMTYIAAGDSFRNTTPSIELGRQPRSDESMLCLVSIV